MLPPVCFYTVSFQFKLIPSIFCCHLTDYNASNHISGAAIDLSSLIVVEGKVCWDLYIDGLVVSSDGNLLDALAAAIKVSVDLYLVVSCNFHCHLFRNCSSGAQLMY